jgi:D-alanine-D-alanine ligase
MQKIQKHIEIVHSSVTKLSSMGLKSTDALYAVLKHHYAVVGISTVNNVADLKDLVTKQPDLVFIGLKYVPGNRPHSKIWVSGYLTRHGIAHTGSPQKAIEYEQDKSLAKQRMLDLGIATSQYIVVANGEQYNADQAIINFPLFIKPANLGAGRGVDDKSIVHSQAQLNTKLALLSAEFGTSALIEKYLPGREFSVAVLREKESDNLIGMPVELLPGADINGDYMLSHRLKSGVLETPVAAVTEPYLRAQLVDLALQAFRALGARDYGRIDIRLDAKGIPHFLEANLIPCIIEGSGNFPKACVLNLGMDYETMILHIVNLAFERAQSAQPRPAFMGEPKTLAPAVI